MMTICTCWKLNEHLIISAWFDLETERGGVLVMSQERKCDIRILLLVDFSRVGKTVLHYIGISVPGRLGNL